MMEPYKELYMATNIKALDHFANARSQNININKLDQVYKILNTLYESAQANPLDQEKTYIYLVRFMFIYEKFKFTDKKFMELRFGKEYEKVKFQVNDIKNSLIRRYEDKFGSKGDSDVIIPQQEVPQPKKTRIFNKKFITCMEMYSALRENNNILIVDARCSSDFEQSRMNMKEVINVPENCIVSGLSANTLGQKLPPETREIWEKRDQFNVLILFDWDTTSENFNSSKLDKLYRALVEWDPNRHYNEPPVILNGGYLEILQVYPSICSNPHVSLQKKDTELDELLDIDNIVYPTEADNKAPVMGKLPATDVPEPSQIPEDLTSRDELLEETKKLSMSLQNVISELLKKEEEWKLIDKTKITATDDRKIKLQEDIKQLEVKLGDINVKKDKIRKKFDLYAKFDPENELLKSDEINIINELEKEDDEKLKILEIMQDERYNALKKARALKPSSNKAEDQKIYEIIGETDKPVINRATKPRPQRQLYIQPIEQMTPGKIGLKNVKNTCYMNTIIQCFRNIPEIQVLFCSGKYVNCIKKQQPTAIIYETAYLVRYLWSKYVKYVEPNEFYKKICTLEPNYKLGRHEDCMEFFLFFINHLSEDCSIDIVCPYAMTPKQKSWYNQFQGKESIFINLFYHQIRITQICKNCNINSYKFEIENSFMLSVPDYDCSLDNLMWDYMKDFIITDYLCTGCRKPVLNRKSFSYQPRVLVIVLKRYQTAGNGVLTKNTHKVRFPLNNFKMGDSYYKLNSIAMHTGDLNFGHYTAACLTTEGWLEFNDENVKPIDIETTDVQLRATAFFYTICDNKKVDDVIETFTNLYR